MRSMTKSYVTLLSLVCSIGCVTKEVHNHYHLSGDSGDPGAEDPSLGDSGSASSDGDTGITPDDGDTGTLATDSGPAELAEYCDGADPLLVDCDPEVNYDPWLVDGGERHYWIRDGKTLSFPFTVETNPEVYYGYFQITSGERKRDKYTEDIFHLWISETPNGPVLNDGDPDCEHYNERAQTNFKWHQNTGDPLVDGMCDVGTTERVLYANFETRCVALFYEGICDDDNLQKSLATYQFDVARRLTWRD